MATPKLASPGYALFVLACCCLPAGTWGAPIPESEEPKTPVPLQVVRLMPGEYPLHWCRTAPQSVFGPPALRLFGQPRIGLKVPPSPRGTVRRHAALVLGTPRRAFSLMLDASEGWSGGFDTLYADADGDGRITPDERHAGRVDLPRKGHPGSVAFPAIEFACRYGQNVRSLPIRVTGTCLGERSWTFRAALEGCWQGEVDTDRGRMAVFLQDEGCRAVYDRRFSEKDLGADGPGVVSLYLDRTLTGQIADGGAVGDQAQVLNQVQCFCGRLYRFTPSPAGDRLRIEALTGAPGTLMPTGRTPRGDRLFFDALMLYGSPGLFLVSGAASIELPEGDYRLLMAGARGQVRGEPIRYGFGGPDLLRVAAGRTTWLPLGGPLTLRARLLAPGERLEGLWPWLGAAGGHSGQLVLPRGTGARLAVRALESHGYHFERMDGVRRYDFTLKNAQGRSVLTGSLGAETVPAPSGTVWTPKGLPPGSYTLEIVGDTGVYQGRVTGRQHVTVR